MWFQIEKVNCFVPHQYSDSDFNLTFFVWSISISENLADQVFKLDVVGVPGLRV
jgi:hypothetical protein